MASNRTPADWTERAAKQVRPRTIVTSRKPEDWANTVEERPAVRYQDLELHVPGDEDPPEPVSDAALFIFIGAVFAMLVGLSVWGPAVFQIVKGWLS